MARLCAYFLPSISNTGMVPKGVAKIKENKVNIYINKCYVILYSITVHRLAVIRHMWVRFPFQRMNYVNLVSARYYKVRYSTHNVFKIGRKVRNGFS